MNRQVRERCATIVSSLNLLKFQIDSVMELASQQGLRNLKTDAKLVSSSIDEIKSEVYRMQDHCLATEQQRDTYKDLINEKEGEGV